LTRKELGGGAHHGLVIDSGGSKSGDDGGFPMAMLGQEDKGRLRVSHNSSAGKKFVQGRMGNGGGDRQLLKAIVAAWGGGGDQPGVVPRGEEMEGGDQPVDDDGRQ
jgi:hypothetical protein